MVIDQRNAGAAVTPVNGQYLTDRWVYGATQTSKFTAGQGSGGSPVGFTNYLAYTSASSYSVLAGDFFITSQQIEGFNVADLGWGTANAKTVTLSFVVLSSLTGTFGGSLRNGAANRSYPFTYSIPVANTWTTVSVTIAGDTTGTWLTNNGNGITVAFSLGAGSTFSGTSGAWAAGNFISATGSVNVVGTNGATFYVTGVQLERGTQATSFEYRQYQQEFALCQRYYWKNISSATADAGLGGGFQTSVISASIIVNYPVTMRALPTFTFSNLIISDNATYNATVTSIDATAFLTNSVGYINCNYASAGVLYRPSLLRTNAIGGFLAGSAEL
jgi:hypothetical protein